MALAKQLFRAPSGDLETPLGTPAAGNSAWRNVLDASKNAQEHAEGHGPYSNNLKEKGLNNFVMKPSSYKCESRCDPRLEGLPHYFNAMFD